MTTAFLFSGCGGKTTVSTPTPVFFTATLPPTITPQATQSPTLPVQSANATEEPIQPVEGMTTAQVNVRTEPSTASASLGMLGIFIKLQVIGRDASGSWYQVLYAESETGKGWVRAEYVQVNSGAEIRLVETISGSRFSGMVVQKANVRSGPGIEYELLGALNPDDLVFITGRDEGSKWIQIEFAGASDGKGWVTAELLQVSDIESVPQIGAVEETPTPMIELPSMTSTKTAAQDGDSMQSPLAVTVFSPMGARALQVQGDISTPDGDVEDWIQFTSQGSVISIQATCTDAALRVELWNNGNPVNDFSCGEIFLVDVVPGDSYFLRLIQTGTGYTGYVLNLEGIP